MSVSTCRGQSTRKMPTTTAAATLDDDLVGLDEFRAMKHDESRPACTGNVVIERVTRNGSFRVPAQLLLLEVDSNAFHWIPATYHLKYKICLYRASPTYGAPSRCRTGGSTLCSLFVVVPAHKQPRE